MEIIVHIAVLAFTVIVILGAGIFVVIDMFGRVDYLKDKAPWLQKALERRGALGVLVVVAIFLAVGDGYELLIKEVPEVPTLPEVQIKAPLAPEISKCEIRLVSQGGKTPPQQQPCPPQTAMSQAPATVRQATPPQTQLERLTETNKNLSKGDRDRLAETLFDYAKFLDQGSALFYKANNEGGQIQHGWQDGSIAKDFEVHIKNLREIDASAWAYSKAFRQIRDKWKYYPEQTEFIFGDNPDNLGPNSLINAIESYANYLENWAKVSDKDEKGVLNLLGTEQNDFNDYMSRFIHWEQGCEQRLELMKKSIQ